MTLEQPDNLEGKKDTTTDVVAALPAAEAEHGAVKKKIDIPVRELAGDSFRHWRHFCRLISRNIIRKLGL